MKRPVIILITLLTLVLCITALAESQSPQTVMIYMVGSDLESDGGIATKDMAEIANAGGNAVRILLYAGGAEHWQSDMPRGRDGVFELVNSEWKLIDSPQARNMGDPGTLTDFLTFGYERYNAQSYALILWNHGSGPMVGYGRDEMHGGDPLSLPELRTALLNSPFSEENKLEWVGFDACLMGSIETAKLMSPFARYMIASQEAEPSTGWNYAFLSDIEPGESGDVTGKRICESYVDGLLSRYVQVPEFAPPVTLSCLDLTHVQDVERAMDELARAMTGELTLKTYSKTTRSRILLDGFGRLTTGSEFDLVDLPSLVESFSADYPEQTSALTQSLNRLVVHNQTNIDDARGVSIYYPFYNKQFYTSAWRREYVNLGFSSDYAKYLQAYSRIWLGKRLSAWDAETLPDPQANETGNEFSLQLTPEQLETFGSAGYYVLRRGAGEMYQMVYFSRDVSLHPNGLLVANYDGRALFCINAATGAISGLVPGRELARDDNALTIRVGSALGFFANNNVFDIDSESISAEIHVKVDRASDRAEIVGIMPTPEEGKLDTGKHLIEQQDADMITLGNGLRYKTHDSDGRLLAYEQWERTGIFEGFEYYTKRDGQQGVTFRMLDASNSEHDLFLMLVIDDVQGSTSTSELIPIHIRENTDLKALPPVQTRQVDVVALDVSNPAPIDFPQQHGLQVTFNGINPKLEYYARLNVRLTNHTDQHIEVSIDQTNINDFIEYISIGPVSESLFVDMMLEPGQTTDAILSVSIDTLAKLRQTSLNSIEFRIYATAPGDYDRLFELTPMRVELDLDLSDVIGMLPLQDSGMIEPTHIELGDIASVSLLSAQYDPYSSDLHIKTLVENKSDQTITLDEENVSVDDYMSDNAHFYCSDLLPGKKRFTELSIAKKDMDMAGITQPGKAEFKLLARAQENHQVIFRSDIQTLTFQPKTLPQSQMCTVLDQDNVLIQLQELDAGLDQNAAFVLRMYVENNNPFDIEVQIDEERINGIPASYFRYNGHVAAGKKLLTNVTFSLDNLAKLGQTTAETIHMRLRLVDSERDQFIGFTNAEVSLMGDAT